MDVSADRAPRRRRRDPTLSSIPLHSSPAPRFCILSSPSGGWKAAESKSRQKTLGEFPLAARNSVCANLVPEVAECEFIARFQVAFLHLRTVDFHAVRTAQIADHESSIHLGQTAVPAGDLLRIQLHVAFLMAAEQQDRLVDQDRRAIGEREQIKRHGRNRAERRVLGFYHFTFGFGSANRSLGAPKDSGNLGERPV